MARSALRALCFALTLAAPAWPDASRAQEPSDAQEPLAELPGSKGAKPYLSTGLTLGGATGHGRSDGMVAGYETSLVFLKNSLDFVGAYADVVYDGGLRGGRMSIGPEIGHSIVGIDGGLAVQWAERYLDLGFHARLFSSLGPIAAYVRICHFPYSKLYPTSVEFGTLLKLPIPIG